MKLFRILCMLFSFTLLTATVTPGVAFAGSKGKKARKLGKKVKKAQKKYKKKRKKQGKKIKKYLDKQGIDRGSLKGSGLFKDGKYDEICAKSETAEDDCSKKLKKLHKPILKAKKKLGKSRDKLKKKREAAGDDLSSEETAELEAIEAEVVVDIEEEDVSEDL